MVVSFVAKIDLQKGGTQSLIMETPKEPLQNLANYLGGEEKKVVDWLLHNPSFKNLVFKKFFSGEKSVQYHTSIQEPLTQNGKRPGDIDVLLFSSIKNAIAIECKIVKVTSQENASAKINKVEKLKKASKQANAYLKFGFSQVYFLVIILDDGRNYNKQNFIFNHTSSVELIDIYKGDWKTKLNEDIGIMYCTIEQTRNLNIDLNNNISLQIERPAKIKVQNERLNLLLAEFDISN